MPFCPGCRVPVEPESPACPECFLPLRPQEDERHVALLRSCLQPVPPPASRDPGGRFSLRDISFTPSGWWTRVGIPWLRVAIVLMVLGLLGLAAPVALRETREWQAARRGAGDLALAGAALEAGRRGEARLCLERAAESFHQAGEAEREAQARAQWAELALEEGELEKAAEVYAVCAGLDPRYGARSDELKARWARHQRLLAGARLSQGRNHLARKQYEQALAKAGEALRLYSSFGGDKHQRAAAHRLLAQAYQRLGSKKAAAEQARLALSCVPGDPATKQLLAALTAKPATPNYDYVLSASSQRTREENSRRPLEAPAFQPPGPGYPTYIRPEEDDSEFEPEEPTVSTRPARNYSSLNLPAPSRPVPRYPNPRPGTSPLSPTVPRAGTEGVRSLDPPYPHP